MMTVDEILDQVVAILAQNGIPVKQCEGVDDRLLLVDNEGEQNLRISRQYDFPTRADAVVVEINRNLIVDGMLAGRALLCFVKINQRKGEKYIKGQMEEVIRCYHNLTR